MAYSVDLRERVLALYDDGLPTKEVAERLKVARSWARRIKQLRGAGKSIAPKPVGGSRPELGVAISVSALWETLAAMRLTLKKSR